MNADILELEAPFYFKCDTLPGYLYGMLLRLKSELLLLLFF